MATCVCGREIKQPLTGRPRKRCDRCSPRRDQLARKAPLLQLPVKQQPKPRRSLTEHTLADLQAVGREDTTNGAAALHLAELLDVGGYTAQGATALVKAHREALDLALEGTAKTADVIDLIFANDG